MKIYYLTPHSTYSGVIRSDTLWGLICWGIRNIYNQDVLQMFIRSYLDKDTKHLLISSAFPFTGAVGREATLFFPRPQLKPLDRTNILNKYTEKKKRIEISILFKKFKEIPYVEKSVLEHFLIGDYDEQTFFLDYAKLNSRENLFSDAEFIHNSFSKVSYIGKSRKYEVLHNTIDRITTSTPKEGGGLFSKNVSYAPRERKTGKNSGGLFFLADGNEENIKLMEAALRFLSHFGFGGDCSTGNNHFTINSEDFEFKVPANPNSLMTLSLVAPTHENIAVMSDQNNRFKCWYDIIARKGKLGGHFVKVQNFWKKTRPLITEGSIFPFSNIRYGSIYETAYDEANLGYTPYSYGIAFSLPMKIKGV